MRPEFHFTAPTGWINDPHGITFRDGKYHVFYQYVPDQTVWGAECEWGHAIGDTLLELEHLPVALGPGDGDDGVWTGSLVTDDAGDSRIFYTSVQKPGIGIGRIRSALPEDDSWIRWNKQPVLFEAPADLEIVAYRDPFVLREGNGWRMFVGAGFADGTAAAIGYSSPNLEDWSYDGIAVSRSSAERDPVWMGALWECPQIFDVDGRHVLVSSVWEDDVLYYAGYGVGTLQDGRFVAETWGQLTFGPSYYAPSFFRDAAGRPCLILWMRGVKDETVGWAGAHSVPHTLRLDGDRLVAEPHPDLEQYRGTRIAPGATISGLALDISWKPTWGSTLVVSSGGTDAVRLTQRGRDIAVVAGSRELVLPYRDGAVRVLLDGPVVEISCSGGILGCDLDPAADGYTIDAGNGEVTAYPLSRKLTR